MRSIERRFKYRQVKYLDWSTWTCFVDAVIDQGFSKEIIQINFNKLVDKNDYAQNEKRQLLKHLYQITNKA